MPKIPPELTQTFQQFTEGPTLVARAIEGILPSQLNRPGREGWSTRDVLLHLADAELMAALRFRMVLAEERPTLPVYDPDTWKKKLHYLWRSPEAALSLFQQMRFGTAELLQQCTLSDWERVGIHPERGEMTLGALLQLYSDHAFEHVAQIEALRG